VRAVQVHGRERQGKEREQELLFLMGEREKNEERDEKQGSFSFGFFLAVC
jgi:hypothetical protein